MNSKYAQSKLEYLDRLFLEFAETSLEDEIKSYIARFLTVLISGMFEDIIKNIIKEFVKKDKICAETEKFLFKSIELSFRNPDRTNLQSFLKKFNPEWAKELNSTIEEINWESLNSIVANKNNIAHGELCLITFEDINQYYYNSKKIIIEIDRIVTFH